MKSSANVQSKKEKRFVELVWLISQQRQSENTVKPAQRSKRVKQSDAKEDFLDQLLVNLETVRNQKECLDDQSEKRSIFSLEKRLVSRIVVCLIKVSGRREKKKAVAFYFDFLGELLLLRKELDKECMAESAANLLGHFVDISRIWPDPFSLDSADQKSPNANNSNEAVQFLLKSMRFVIAGLEGGVMSTGDDNLKQRYARDLAYLSAKIVFSEQDVSLDDLLDSAVVYLTGIPAHPGESKLTYFI